MLKFAKVMVAAWVPVFAAAAAGATSQSTPLFTISPETTSILGPVRPDGSIDYVAAMNQLLSDGVTPENNGFVLWLRVMGVKSLPQSTRMQMLKMCGAEGLQDTAAVLKDYNGTSPIENAPSMRLWKQRDDPAFVDYLKQEDGALSMAAQAAERPRWWEPLVSSNGTLIEVLLPELNSLNNVSWLLCERALLRAEQGDFDGFMADVMTVKHLARRSGDEWLVCRLVAIHMDDMADQAIGIAVGSGLFLGPQCAKLAGAMDNLKPLSPMWQTIDRGERWAELDMVQFIAKGDPQMLETGNADYDRWIKPFKTVDRDSVDWNAVLKRMNGLSDEMVAILKSPSVKDELAAQRKFDREIAAIKAKHGRQTNLTKRMDETADAYSQRIADAVIAVRAPSLSRAEATYRRILIKQELAHAVVAAGQYKADKGKWPDKLDDLTPEYLPVALTETLTKFQTEPVRYLHKESGISLHVREVWNEGDPTSPDISVGVK